MSKIAVMAIVAIIAAPILVGYGMNFQTDTENRYERDGSAVSVTNLLSNGTEYTFTNANVNNLNFDNVNLYGGSDYFPNLPDYRSKNTTNKTSIQLASGTLGSSDDLTNIYYLRADNVAAGSSSTLGLTVTTSTNATYSFTKVLSIYYNKNDAKAWIHWYPNNHVVIDNPVRFTYTNYSGIPAYWSSASSMANASARFVDISKGWTFPAGYSYYHTPTRANDMLITIDIDSSTSNTLNITPFSTDGTSYGTGAYFHKVGNDWYVSNPDENYPNSEDVKLPYNDELNNNSYQLKYTRSGVEVRYIGAWPDAIGESNYYWSHNFTFGDDVKYADREYIEGFSTGVGVHEASIQRYTMTFRVDAANVLANTYNVITDATYDPANQTNKTNPETVFNNIIKYGSSIQFGENTYEVKNGKITLQGHDVPVDMLSFSSTLREDGQYDNEIGGTFISTTATPSTIVYGGSWVAGITTYAQVQKEYKITHWEPGKFAWAGIDTNFLLVGLMASVASFVALAMYGRRSGAKVLPLLLVCGGAALVFVLMM